MAHMDSHTSASTVPPERKNKYLWLLIALILFSLVMPLQHELGIANKRYGVNVLTALVLILGVHAACRDRVLRFLGTALWVVTAALAMIAEAREGDIAGVWTTSGRSTSLVAFILLIGLILRDVFTGSISRDRLRGAACAYLLMGVAFGAIYLLIEFFCAESFVVSQNIKGPVPADGKDVFNASRASYYSFVTLTTLGYGDVSPIRPFAQAVAYLEACVGQFYLTVLVAFLVGMRLAKLTDKD